MARELVYPEDYYRMQKRVRELEAELAKERSLRYAYAERIDGWVEQVSKEQTRAEKAKADLEAVRKSADILDEIALDLKARVAELERRLDYLRRDPAVRTRELIGEQLGELEARERKVRR